KHAYDEYQAMHEHRTEVVLVGANDGMLHAFNAGNWVTGDDPDTPLVTESAHYDLGTGKEEWAFIPPDLLPKLQRYIINTRPEALNSGESWNDVAPGAPPIVNVVVADLSGPINRGPTKASEKWVVGIGGGFDPDLLRGRGIHILDAWKGDELFRFSRADSTGAT